MRIFVTVGNATASFDRLLRTVDLAVRRVPGPVSGTCQFGVGTSTVERLNNSAFLSRKAFEDEMRSADVVICHGGVGALRAAREFGHVPFALARLKHLGEAVDNHQLEIVNALRDEGLVRIVTSPESLSDELQAVGPTRRPCAYPSEALDLVLSAIERPVPPPRPHRWAFLRLLGLGRRANGLVIHGGTQRDP